MHSSPETGALDCLPPPLYDTQSEIDEDDEEHILDDDYCPICYAVPIIRDPNVKIGADKDTFEFSCKHRFCNTCSAMTLRDHIVNNELHKLNCPESSCKQ